MNRRRFQQLLMMAAVDAGPFQRRLLALSAGEADIVQPLLAQVRRLMAALEWIGEPLTPAETAELTAVLASPSGADKIARVEAVLKPHVLLQVEINPESRVSVTRGSAKAELVEHGWRSFLVRVSNQAGDTSVLQIRSPQARAMGRPSGNDTAGVQDFTIGAVDAVEAQSRWLALNNWDEPPLQRPLSGLEIEYRIVQLYSRDRGRREASLEAVTAAGEQDLGYRSTVAILFDAAASQPVKLHISDGGRPATASLLITDKLGRVYPAQSKRELPDLWFQPQIYRSDAEGLSLPQGAYTVEYGRGPEYVRKRLPLDVQGSQPPAVSLVLERWVTPSRFGYYSGDTHIHAAGCSHYESPTEGVTPEVMLRQVEGEALDLGAVLTWAPGFLYQSQFFSGHVHPFATAADMHRGMATQDRAASPQASLRYDLEVSGFPSSACGHLVLLRLREQNYPGTSMPGDWPSWNVPILKWAKSQGSVTGYAHSGWGMAVDSVELPNYLIPKFDSCGANEALVDVTHEGLLDFISGCDTWPFVELNFWYHVLNCGLPLRFAGETDFPCITDHSVGGGRTYVKLGSAPQGDEGYTDWLVQGLQHGKSYFGDGRSHLLDFSVEGETSGGATGVLHYEAPTTVRLTARVCARLEPEITPVTEKIRKASPYDRPYWHLERARIGKSRRVPVELIVNGHPVQRVEIEADGEVHPVGFEISLQKSSWVALRILPSSHTNQLTLLIDGRPVRASKESAEWCRRGVDACWEQKKLRIRPSEIAEAKAAYEHARSVYDRILSETHRPVL